MIRKWWPQTFKPGTGLVLSLRAKNRASKYRKLAKTGIIVSAITPMLFLAALLILLIQAIDWYFSDFFTIGEPTTDQPLLQSA